jgi:hypothetical protein
MGRRPCDCLLNPRLLDALRGIRKHSSSQTMNNGGIRTQRQLYVSRIATDIGLPYVRLHF